MSLGGPSRHLARGRIRGFDRRGRRRLTATRIGPPCATTITVTPVASHWSISSSPARTRASSAAAVSPPGQSIDRSPAARRWASSGSARSIPSKVRPSIRPKSASAQRGSMVTRPSPNASAMTRAVWRARRRGLDTIRTGAAIVATSVAARAAAAADPRGSSHGSLRPQYRRPDHAVAACRTRIALLTVRVASSDRPPPPSRTSPSRHGSRRPRRAARSPAPRHSPPRGAGRGPAAGASPRRSRTPRDRAPPIGARRSGAAITPGARPAATSAAAPVMNPSRTTGIRRRDAAPGSPRRGRRSRGRRPPRGRRADRLGPGR